MKITRILSLLLLPVAAFAQTNPTYIGAVGWCHLGGQAGVTQGLATSGTQPLSGLPFEKGSGIDASYPKCTITVFPTGQTSPAAIFSTSVGGVLSNPFTANVDGSFQFFVLPGCYDITESSGITTGSFMPTNHTDSDMCFGTGGNTTAACPTNILGALAYASGAGVLLCDNALTTDTHGNATGQSFSAVAPWNGDSTVTATGAQSPFALLPHTFAWTAPNVINTPMRNVVPGVPCAVSQLFQVVSQTTDPTSTLNVNWGCLNGSTTINSTVCPLGGSCTIAAGSSVEIQTNGVDNANCVAGACPKLNLVAGTNVTLNNTSAGNVTVTSTGGFASTPLANPAAPTLANQNAAGARSITYAIVGCQDGPTCAFHSAATSTTTIANANASPQVKLTAYGDTLYGYRCYAIYVTADSGGRTLGKIESCAWKNFIDTGGAGDTTTAPATNTTAVFANPKPLPGCNIAFGETGDVDHAPCTVNALDDEFTWGDGTIAPCDSNDPFWTCVNQNSMTATMTNGMMSLTAPSRGVANNYSQVNCLFQTAPSTPYSVKALVYHIPDSSSATLYTTLAFRESATGKIVTIGIYDDNSSLTVLVAKWTNATTVSGTAFKGNPQVIAVNGSNLGLIADGTNTAYYYSNDGVKYDQAFTETKATFFTTAPDQIGQCIMTSSGVGISDYKYFRVKPAASLP